MKTKIYIPGFLLLFSMPFLVSANWYGAYTMPIVPGTTQCSSDAFPDAIAPTIPGMHTGSTTTYFTGGMQARVFSWSATQITCEYWDSTRPTATGSDSSLDWKNTTIPVLLRSQDTGGSGITPTSAKYIWNYNNATPATTFTTAYCLANGTSFADSTTINLTTANQGDHTLYLCNQDIATNTSLIWSGTYRMDSIAPSASSLTYANTASGGWQNYTNITLNWSVSDPATLPVIPSGYKNVDIRVYRIAPATGVPVLFTTLSNVATGATTYAYPGINGYAYRFEILPRDNANNTGAWISSPDIARIDMTPPAPANLTGTTVPNLLASGSQAFTFNFNDGGSPVQIIGNMENAILGGPVAPSIFSPLGYANILTTYHDIHLVDGADRIQDSGTARQYTYRVTQLCDQAGNCASAGIPRNYNYNVYANPNSVVNNSSAISGSGIADGSVNTFTHTITDEYGNDIIPATGISRTVNQNLTGISNTMFLDQFTRSGLTSVYVTAVDNTADQALSTSPPQPFPVTLSSTNGSYPLIVKVYTPTANAYTATEPVSDPNATFGFTSNLIVADSLGTYPVFSRPLVDPVFRPLYTTAITGDLADGGFIEGTIQNSTVAISKAPSVVTPSSFQLQGAFSGSDTGSFEFFGNPPNVWFTPGVPTSIVSGVPPTTPLQSRLLQKSGSTVSNLSNLQFSTHFSYTLDSKSVIYNSDIIGRDSYHSGSLTNVGAQYGVHIIGSIASNAVRAITDGQFAANTSIFGGVSRTTIRNNMNKSIALATRNMTLGTVGSDIGSLLVNPTGGTPGSGGVITFGSDSSIMSLQKNGGYFDLTNGSVTGKRTLVIEGADLYITTDMYYVNSDSILGVVVKKNANGQGGNLYINPGVTNIVGSYVIDGSVITSTDGMNPIGIGDISTLKNQLHIYGSIVSENTIGGSKMLPVKCPTLVNISSCTMDEAQKYDLNYLRRYYLYNDNPFGVGTKVIGGATCTSSVCTGFNPLLKQKFNMTTPAVDLAKYPVIIEQNPVIRTNPPPGFDTTID